MKYVIIGDFNGSEFSSEGCEMIPSIILEEAKHFMTFMSSMVEELLGNEELMISILRN